MNTNPFVLIDQFLANFPHEFFAGEPVEGGLHFFCNHPDTLSLIEALTQIPPYDVACGDHDGFAEHLNSLAAARRLRCCLGGTMAAFTRDMAELAGGRFPEAAVHWQSYATRLAKEPAGKGRLVGYLKAGAHAASIDRLVEALTETDPHAIFPTSVYRESSGSVVSLNDDSEIEAVMTQKTFTSIRIIDDVFSPGQNTLSDIYSVQNRCVCLIDSNVEQLHGDRLRLYFDHHKIKLDLLVYRAMEVDKAIGTVERMLGDFKRLGVSRNEPILIVGGGVLADTGGLACALYHRNTPYVMVGSSIVSGIDAGPSPRTCCDGFGYKNLFGAYHSPILTITDRTLFSSLKEGWLRHGLAEIVKMAVVKDEVLFEQLEAGGADLIRSRLGTVDTKPGSDLDQLSRQIVSGAMRSYVEAEYGNLYETHQARPHAYGHTWSPGFEIAAGLLHGHAVSVGMGFGAFLSYQQGWISEDSMHRIQSLIEKLELSLWSDVLLDRDLVWESQVKIVEKRGGHLAAPLPRNRIGNCGYLTELSRADLFDAIDQYQAICKTHARSGVGREPLCEDVGLEDPSTVGTSTVAETATV